MNRVLSIAFDCTRLHSKSYLLPTLYSLLFAAVAVSATAADITLKVTPSRQSIYLSESFNLTVEIVGADRGVAEPDLSALKIRKAKNAVPCKSKR
jgi:hypothetical protein